MAKQSESDIRQLKQGLILDKRLKSPKDPNANITFEHIMALDEEEAYPEKFLQLLYKEHQLQLYLIPAEQGGNSIISKHLGLSCECSLGEI